MQTLQSATVQLRPALGSDSDAVRRLVFAVLAEYGLAPEPDGRDLDLADLAQSYAGPGNHFEVLVDAGGDVVGSVALLRIDDDCCELRKMYLDPRWRGIGWGRRMLDHALHLARKDGFRKVTLETNTGLKEAIALYRHHGFQPAALPCNSGRCDQVFELHLDAAGRT